MGVQSMTIKGYKSIKTLDLNLGSLNVLIGANGAGKSNLISVFRLFNELAENKLQTFIATSGGANALLHYGRKISDEIYLKFADGKNGYETFLLPTDDDGFVFRDESALFLRPDLRDLPYKENLGAGHRESRLSGRPNVPAYVLKMMKTWKVYHFHDTSTSAGMKQTGDVNDNKMLRPDASNLAAFLFRLQQKFPEEYTQITDTIRIVAPFFRDFALQTDRINPEKIRLEWLERASDAYLNAHSLSDGTLRFMCLATLLLQPELELPKTVLIDEPELGLHPSAIHTLAELFRDAATRTQLVVSTQSASLVNRLIPDELIIVDRIKDASHFRRLEKDEVASWLDAYALGDLWEKNVIGGRP